MTLDSAPQPEPADLGFDPDALREKYRQERDKRLRADGNDQYRKIAGDFARYLDDPYVEPGFTREALTDEVEVAIIGGGFCGLVTGARLREAGVEDLRVIETAGDFGGTWYWNRYPGVQCDIESYIYLPLLEELHYIPKEKYSHGAEIQAHAQAIARHYDLYRNACFRTHVKEMRWDDAAARWILSTSRLDCLEGSILGTTSSVTGGTATIIVSGPREVFETSAAVLQAFGDANYLSSEAGAACSFDKVWFAYD